MTESYQPLGQILVYSFVLLFSGCELPNESRASASEMQPRLQAQSINFDSTENPFPDGLPDLDGEPSSDPEQPVQEPASEDDFSSDPSDQYGCTGS